MKATRDQARADAERASALLQSAAQQAITPLMLRNFARTARQCTRRLEGGGYRRDHLRALAQRVEVDRGEVRIMGSKSNLLRLLVTNGVGAAAGGVPSIVPKWRSDPDAYVFQGQKRGMPLSQMSMTMVLRPPCLEFDPGLQTTGCAMCRG